MMGLFNDNEEDKNQGNYPIEKDISFTPDEIERIETFIHEKKLEITKLNSLNRGIEQGFWAITAYSVSRYLILTGGMTNFIPVIAINLVLNQIVNRDLIETDSDNNEDNLMAVRKGLNILGGVIAAILTVASATGDLLNYERVSTSAYHAVRENIETYNNLGRQDKNDVLTFLAGMGGFTLLIFMVLALRK